MNGICKLHNVTYYNLKPRAINHMSYCKNECKIALTREDASIEIWDVSIVPNLQKLIPNENGVSIESLCWVNHRLFSGGLAGDITEWDLKNLTPKKITLATGSSVWCIDCSPNKELIIVGTNEGYLNVFNVPENDDISYEKILDKQEGAIYCCKFDKSSKFIVSGSNDCLRIWNIETGHVLHKMSTGLRTVKGQPTIVWALHVFNDFTIASGDSRGRLTFWDGNLGTQIESHLALKADVLCLTANDEENLLYCSGVDPTVKIFSHTPIKTENQLTHKWVKTINVSYHINDVKTMVNANGNILTGGIDGYLISASQPHLKFVRKFPPLIQNPVSVSETTRVTLFKYTNYLELWRLGESNPDFDNSLDENDIPLKTGPKKLLEFRSKNDATITAAAISTNGKWLSYSTNRTIRLFKVEIFESQPPVLTQMKNLPEEFVPCSIIKFSFDSKRLFSYSTDGVVNVFELTKDEIDFKQTILITKFIKDVVHILTVDETGKYMICAGLCNNISVWILNKNGQYSHYINLPKYKYPPTALSIRPKSFLLTAIFVDKKIFEYDIEELKFTFSSILCFPKTIIKHFISHITFDYRNENIIILSNDIFIGVVDKKQKYSTDKRIKIIDSDTENSGKEEKENNDAQTFCDINLIKRYNFYMHLSWLGENEMIAVGFNPISVIEQLPPTLKKKVFGRS